jgi:PhnB protein
MTTIKPIPHGYRTLTPYLVVSNLAEAVQFYNRALGGDVYRQIRGPQGLMHAELKVGDCVLMVAQEHAEAKSPQSLGGTPVSTCVYVDNVDAFVDTALKAGAKLTRPIEVLFFGDRMGTVQDPFGHIWHIATHVEDMSEEEMQRRADQKFKGK